MSYIELEKMIKKMAITAYRLGMTANAISAIVSDIIYDYELRDC